MPTRREDRVREPRYRDERRKLDRRYMDEKTGRPAPVYRPHYRGEKDRVLFAGEKPPPPPNFRAYFSGEKDNKAHLSAEKENKAYLPNDKEKFVPPPSGRGTPNINAWLNDDKDAIQRPEERGRPDPSLHPYYAPDKDYEADFNRISSARGRFDSAESLERIYTSPQAETPEADFRKKLGNATPIGLVGYLLPLSALVCDMLGWQGAGGHIGLIGTFFWFGGFLMAVAGFFDWVQGNTFNCIIWFSYSAYWFANASTFIPSYNAYGYYSTDPTNPALGLNNSQFLASYGFFCLFMGFLSLLFLILSLRGNLILVTIFSTFVVAFCMEAAQYWYLAKGEMETANQLMTGAAIFFLINCMAGWYEFVVVLLQTNDFPWEPPMGDLSRFITSGSEKKRLRERYRA